MNTLAEGTPTHCKKCGNEFQIPQWKPGSSAIDRIPIVFSGWRCGCGTYNARRKPRAK